MGSKTFNKVTKCVQMTIAASVVSGEKGLGPDGGYMVAYRRSDGQWYVFHRGKWFSQLAWLRRSA